ncbi:DUF3275 family protein [Nitrogeniibacter aestuarii]|uniref:DUF3275 family protein n=1 Tax=Nitrogeniibacter aestuarii TaxID=2815343 RepID=UPI001E3EF000|nr:DUF3275 family protein [Nitrogeniibacter aestuarii]
MTVTVVASLTVIERTGIHGPFNVGKLRTSFGNFGVRDTFLEELAPGEYKGSFTIAKIWPRQYATDQVVVTEVCVSVADHVIFDAESDDDGQIEHQPDPADDKPLDQPPAEKLPEPKPTDAKSQENAPDAASIAAPLATDLDDFFGNEIASLIRDRQPLKLDPTVDRLTLRKQGTRLRTELEYEFLPADQSWYPSGHPALDAKGTIKF